MQRDAHGLVLSTDSAEAGAAFDRMIESFLKYRIDTPQLLKQTLAADPQFGLAYCFQGYSTMLGFKEAFVPRAADAAKKARQFSAAATPRERAHVDALDAWVAGDLDGVLARWEQILAEHPLDVLAFRLHHFNAFWLGRPRAMRDAVDRVRPRWGAELPGWGTVLACRCFAYEEAGDYSGEADGRRAVELDPADVWAAHAVAHVLEMQGRTAEGVAWVQGLEKNWEQVNNVAHHLWWHQAMFHMERRELPQVLELYDRRFRNLASPLVEAQPDLYIDVQNAVSMLFRLERLGTDVGTRWVELADKAEARIGDHRSAFTLPHWMMALTATGRDGAAQRMVVAMASFARGGGTLGRIVGEVALPICMAIIAHRKGNPAGALSAMRPVLGEMSRLGGSHAQQDVLAQLFLDCALKAGSADDVRLILARVAKTFPVAPATRVGYAQAARRYPAQ